MYVKSGVKCPLCGKEMQLMSGSFYYDNDLRCVCIECRDCGLSIFEYGRLHGFEEGEAQSYHKLVNALVSRVKGAER